MQISNRNIWLVNDEFYFGADPARPRLGDIRVWFECTEPAPAISVLARQTGGALDPWPSRTGLVISMLRDGLLPADAMLVAALGRELGLFPRCFAWIFISGLATVLMYPLVAFGVEIARPSGSARERIQRQNKLFKIRAPAVIDVALVGTAICLAWLPVRIFLPGIALAVGAFHLAKESRRLWRIVLPRGE